jgi:two-component system, cell cycle sensor histidine kinase and response regulator CckA
LIPSTQEHILVVDDEQSLLVVMEQYLRRLGHSVVACRSGLEAWELFERDPTSFTLVLADITLPEMSGAELLARMLRLNPRACILVCSGYPFDMSTLPAVYQRQIGFLQKPFTPRMLADSIARLLADRDAGNTAGTEPRA